MEWARRVNIREINRLYDLAKIGVYDDELLLEVGWGLYARCESILTVMRAVGKGEVICPKCRQLVYRPIKHKMYLESKAVLSKLPSFLCPTCKHGLTWQDCRNALRNYLKCFLCKKPLDWKHAENKVECKSCGQEWTWKQYRQSVRTRKRLPCPYCDSIISQPKRVCQDANVSNKLGNTPSEEYECPRCHGPAIHTNGKLRCLKCCYEQSWKSYRERAEYLQCASCGYRFTWNSWRRQYKGQYLMVGNAAALEDFLSKWHQCKTPTNQLMQIDMLLYAIHARGTIGPAFLAGSNNAVMNLLDKLAQQY